MVRDQKRQNCHEIVRFWHAESEFFQKSLEIFLGGLLAVKTLFIVKWLASPSDDRGEPEVAFGFANPRPSASFHRELCPWP